MTRTNQTRPATVIGSTKSMPKISKNFSTILVAVACFAVVGGAKFFIGLSRNNMSSGTLAKVKGSNKAPIKVTEFIDFQCPACAKGAAYLKEMIEKYPEAIRLELKHFPLQMHEYGVLGARYAECAAQQEKFWPFHDLLLARQGNWRRLADVQPAFDRVAGDVSLNKQELEACLQEGAVDKIIAKNKAEGKTRGVKSTPTYFVNGKMVVGKKSLDFQIRRLLQENGY